jgi:hypothetical protein
MAVLPHAQKTKNFSSLEVKSPPHNPPIPSTNSTFVSQKNSNSQNLDTKKWKKLKTHGDIPSCRSNSSIVCHKNKIICFGGEQNPDWKFSNEIFELDLGLNFQKIFNKIQRYVEMESSGVQR